MAAKSRDGTALASSGDVLLGLCQSAAGLENWKWQAAELEQLASRRPQGALYLLLILPTSTPPGAALRSTMQNDFRDLGPKLRKLIVVPLGDGMWVSVVRTIVRGTLMLSGQSKQQIVEATIERGLDRVLEFASPETPPLATLQLEIDGLFRALDLPRNAA